MDNPLLFLTLLLIAAGEFVNGWTDAPNSIATIIATRVLSPYRAIAMATALNVVGACLGTAVATTIGTDIAKPEAISLSTVSAAMTAVIFWSLLTWYFGIPTSETHALVAGLSGAALAAAGVEGLVLGGWVKIGIGLILSSLAGLGLGWLIARAIQHFYCQANRSTAQRTFARLQLGSAALMAISHGSNDGQKFIGLFTLALFLGGKMTAFTVPLWVILLCAAIMGLGTSLGGMRIIKTMGFKLVRLQPYQGFAAESAAAAAILSASTAGIPLSTTHTIGTALMGVGWARRQRAVHWDMAGQIVFTWIVTFPLCFILGYIAQIGLTLFIKYIS